MGVVTAMGRSPRTGPHERVTAASGAGTARRPGPRAPQRRLLLETSVFVVWPAASTELPLKLIFSRSRVVVLPTLLRLMKIVLPKRQRPPLSFSFALRVASVLRFFLTVSLTLPLQAARMLAPAGGVIVPHARTRTRLPMIFAPSELPGPVKETGQAPRRRRRGAADVIDFVASPALPALSAKRDRDGDEAGSGT